MMEGLPVPEGPGESTPGRNGQAQAKALADERYIAEKNWSESNATLSPAEQAAFEQELARAGLTANRIRHVIEFGFGQGCLLQYGRVRGWEMLGVEQNATLIAWARKQGFPACHASETSTLPAASADLVVALDVLEHIGRSQIVPFLVEVDRLLRPSGTFIARFPNGDSPFGLANQNGDHTHRTMIGKGMARQLCRIVGWDEIHLGAAAEPLRGVGLVSQMQRLAARPVKVGLNLCVRTLFLPGSDIDFSAQNLMFIGRKPELEPET